MKTTNLTKLPAMAKDGTPGEVKYGYHYIQGNSDAYFSVTAWFKGKDRHGHRNEFGGCCHDEILAIRPDLAPLIRLHLSDVDTGAPMHAEANAWYFLAGALGGAGEQYHFGNGSSAKSPEECLQTFAKHCRIEWAEAETILGQMATILAERAPDSVGYAAACRKAKAQFHEIIEAMRPRWKSEAESALKQFNLVA